MTILELTQLDELRTALRAISANLSSIQIGLDLLRGKIEDAYFSACAALATDFDRTQSRDFDENGGMNREAAQTLYLIDKKMEETTLPAVKA